MSTKTINISLPEKLIERIDFQARAHFSNRSEYIRQAITARLQAENALTLYTDDEEKTPQDLRRQKLQTFLVNHLKEKPPTEDLD